MKTQILAKIVSISRSSEKQYTYFHSNLNLGYTSISRSGTKSGISRILSVSRNKYMLRRFVSQSSKL